MPIFAWLLTRLKIGIRSILTVLLLVAWAMFLSPLGQQNQHLRKSLLVYLPYFAMGMWVVDAERLQAISVRSGSRNWQGFLDFLAGAALGGLFFGGAVYKGLESTVARALLCGVFLFAALNSFWVKRLFQIPLVAVIGGMCYSVYLIHLPILEAMSNFTVKVGRSAGLPYPAYLLLQLVLLITPVLVAGWVFFRLVERPCMDREWPLKLSVWLGSRLRRPPADA